MMEKPNLTYIDQLARGDQSIRKVLIDVLKTEFPIEKKEYLESFNSKDFKKLAENVHRLKHKISILSLVKSYKVANNYERNLRDLSIEGNVEFENILEVISKYIETI